MARWEAAAREDPAAYPGLRAEGFQGLVGLDYVFRWWGANDPEELAGILDVLWKVMSPSDESVSCYKTWIKFAQRDFILGIYAGETAKREANREAFRDAFNQWWKLFSEQN